MDCLIRIAEEKDIDQIQGIEERSFAYPFSRRQFLHLLYSRGKFFLVAEKGGDIIGYVAGMRGFRKVVVASVAVCEKYRKKGVATKLMRCFMKKALKTVKKIELQARVSNKPAIFFYEKLGFVCRGILREYYPDKEDAILYYKIFR